MTFSRKELIKSFIKDNDLRTATDVQEALKEFFPETLQGMLEPKMDNHLGYSNESAKDWLTVLNELRTRGVKDILIASIDGLTGFKDAIKAVFPQAEIQRCIIHQIRNSTRYVSYKHLKEFTRDLNYLHSSK